MRGWVAAWLMLLAGATGAGAQEYEVLTAFGSGVINPQGLLLAPDGSLYGVSQSGGLYGNGTVFRLTGAGSTWTRTILHSFGGGAGGNGPDSLMLGTDGAFYGTTAGGVSGHGTLFQLSFDGSVWTHQAIHQFDGTNGDTPSGPLLMGAGGTLFGMTKKGGAGNNGTLFRVSYGSWAHEVLHPFADPTYGRYPSGGLVVGTDGALYGTTSAGGVKNWEGTEYGTAFRLSAGGGSWTHLVVDYFDVEKGVQPSTGLMRAADGALYGTAGWRVFRLSYDGTAWAHEVIGHLSGRATTGLVVGPDGALYGAADDGTAGLVYRMNFDGTAYQVIQVLDVSKGRKPLGPLVWAPDGALYGTTSYGPQDTPGAVYRLSFDGASWVHAIVDSHSRDGAHPWEKLTVGTDGAFYGTTSAGHGTVFRLSHDGTTWRREVVHAFEPATGFGPRAGVVLGPDGALYGTTQYGGPSQYGTVYRLSRDEGGAWTHEVIHTFDFTNGAEPVAELVVGPDGALYGTTQGGGIYHLDCSISAVGVQRYGGTAFRLSHTGGAWTHAVIHSFTGPDGSGPEAPLVVGPDGALYGTTHWGGATKGGEPNVCTSLGAVFRLSHDGSGWTHEVLSSSAYNPATGLVVGTDGALYGTTTRSPGSYWPDDERGFIYRLVSGGAGGWTTTMLRTISPRASELVVGSDGALYGTTADGGPSNVGTVFAFFHDGSAWRLNTLHGFDGFNGGDPEAGLAVAPDGRLYGTTRNGGWTPEGGGAGVVFAIRRGPPSSDRDSDGVPDWIDNCSDVWNADQADADADGTGNLCDAPEVSVSDGNVLEGNAGETPSFFTVTLSWATGHPVTVRWQTRDGSAKAGLDYVATAGELVFAPGEKTKKASVSVLGDTIFEEDHGSQYEYFAVAVTEATGAIIPDGLASTFQIYDDDPFGIQDARIGEGHEGMRELVFTVALSEPLAQAVSVGWETLFSYSAQPGIDYVPGAGTLTFAPGETSQTLSVAILGDRVWEADEYFEVRLRSLSGISGQVYRFANGWIENDEKASRDLGGDLKSDIVWRHAAGATYLWQMNGWQLKASSDLSAMDPQWTIQGMGDFDGDDRSDLLWREAASGSTYLWLMDGASTVGQGYTASQADNAWSIEGVGDFDGDARSDILWRHTGGALYVWQMEGTGIKSSSYLDPISLSWTIKGLGDFNGDGKTDILWREEASGDTYVWFMDGATAIGSGYTASVADNTWVIQGVGDFDGDGKSDILWRHTGGALYVWQMDGTDIAASSYLPPISLSWTIRQLGDFNGDGKTDILWRETASGETYVWLMDGATALGSGYTASQANNDWVIQGK